MSESTVLNNKQWVDRDQSVSWSDYPLGTLARESWGAGHWIRVKSGWKWNGGSTFSQPGAANQVSLPSED